MKTVAAGLVLFLGIGMVGSAESGAAETPAPATAAPVTPAPYQFSMTLVKQTGRNPYGVPDGMVWFTDRAWATGTVVDVRLEVMFIPENRYPARLVDGSCADAMRLPVKYRLEDVQSGKSTTVVKEMSAYTLGQQMFSIAVLDVAGKRMLWCGEHGFPAPSPRPSRS